MRKVFIFDLFGTLLKVPESLFVGGGRRTWLLLKRYGFDVELDVFQRNWEECLRRMEAESYVTCVEFHFFDFVKNFLRENFPSKPYTSNFVKLLAETFLWEWNRGVKPYNESRTVICKLSKNHRLGLISNTHYPSLVYQNLAKTRLDNFFDVVVTSVEFGIKKPDRRIFEHAARLMGVKTGNCIYVGDDPKDDYEGAISAGMEAILIDRENKYCIKTLKELIPWIAQRKL